jgi:hypothetical protein
MVAAMALTAAVCAGAAACGSGSGSARPQGLNGKETGVAGSSFAAEDAAARASMTPEPGSFLAGKTAVTLLGSTTPSNGDENPYAILPVSKTVGSLSAGDVLVDNFNDSSNFQGTGTTIVNVHPGGKVTVFAQLPNSVPGCPGGVGLTTAMVQLSTGWIIVGSLPSTDGGIDTVGRGCLLVLSAAGRLAGTISGPYLDGPWDAAVKDDGATATLFVTNTLFGITHTSPDTVLVHRGDVVRLSLSQSATSPPAVTAERVVASGFPERPDSAAFIKGPTGLALSASGTLYVGDNLDNRVASVPSALTRTTSDGIGTTLSSGGQLANPLGVVLAPDGDLLVANATNGKIVEITQAGRQVGEDYADDDIGQDPPGMGDLFDVAIDQAGTGVLFVNDGTNTLELLHS